MRRLRLLGLGLRLAVAGGRAAVLRLALMSFGLAIGITMLLGALSVPSALASHDRREAIRYGDASDHPGWWAAEVVNGVRRRWVGTTFEGRHVEVMAVEPIGDPPIPPGIPRLPAAGEAFVSPALARVLEGPDGSLLRPRVPGRIVGTIATDGLIEPGELTAWIGADRSLEFRPGWTEVVTAFAPVDRGQGAPLSAGAIIALSVVVVCVAFPIALFVLTATRLSTSTREARLAAVRLAGGTQGQVRLLAAIEAGLAALVAGALAVPTFELARPAGVSILRNVAGYGFFVGDFAPSLFALVAVLVLVPLFAVATAVLSMRRVAISPLGIVRRSRRIRRGWFWPAAFGAGLIALWVFAADPDAVLRQPKPIPTLLVASALIAILVGLAGMAPWLAWLVARRIATWRPSPAVLLGVRRLEAEPTAAARVVMSLGILIALAAVAEGSLLTSASLSYVPRGVRALPADAIVVRSYAKREPARREQLSGLASIPGVRSLEVTNRYPDGLSTCPAACLGIARSDGRPQTVERIRNEVRWDGEVQTATELRRESSDVESSRWLQMLQLATLLVLAVTAANLVVSTVDGMMERRRPLAVLSAIGVPLATLRRSILVQAVLPLATALALGVATGLIVTDLVFRFVEEPSRVMPTAPVLVTAAAVGATALLVTVGSFPWLRMVRRPELLRSE
ncbi:MAG TPA: FtsX-like permease family protein [Actinomycetota bacterium]|jgi:hypothetical protein